MLHDVTYCVAEKCPYISQCLRHVDNNRIDDKKHVAYCNFEHTDIKCGYFISRNQIENELDDMITVNINSDAITDTLKKNMMTTMLNLYGSDVMYSEGTDIVNRKNKK